MTIAMPHAGGQMARSARHPDPTATPARRPDEAGERGRAWREVRTAAATPQAAVATLALGAVSWLWCATRTGAQAAGPKR